MTYYKQLFYSFLLLIVALPVHSQTNGSNSPYSRFGVGSLNDQSQGFNKAMSGLSMGWRDGKIINKQNPASYSAIDSLTFIFDVGMMLQNANFKSGGNSVNAHNTSLEYVNGAFRLCPGLGMSFGFLPYSTIGYNFSESKYLGENFTSGSSMTYTNTYNGDGGIHEAYLGLGWNPFADFSIGANISFLWGNYSQSVKQTFYENGSSSTTSNGLNRQINADFSTYKLDIGIQYPIKINKNDILTLGATYGLGHKLNSTAHYASFVTSGDTTKIDINKAFSLPHTIGFGLAWQHKQKLTLGLDAKYQMWSKCNVPQIIDNQFVSSSDNYNDKIQIIAGGTYQPNKLSNKYLQRIKYSMGVSYSTPYYKVNGVTGPREFGVSAGFCFPLSKQSNSNSLLNISAQWINVSASSSSLITENYFRLNVGITFNEKWFMKWKIQ